MHPRVTTSLFCDLFLLVAVCAFVPLRADLPPSTTRAVAVQRERQPIPDQGDGTFLNPILTGHYHDPTVVRVGEDFYLSHCEHDKRGPLIWHSRDLVNWQPLARVESVANLNDIWATDLVYHEGLFYLYLPIRQATIDGQLTFSNVVVTANDPAGPWSAPVDLGVGGIDPGHVVDRDGTRYLYVNAGRVVKLSPDGLSTVGEQHEVYSGWAIPSDWTIECHCLESPKLFWRDGWCYMVSAQGGTAGPSTSHMIVVARSRSALGPWENDPDSPFLRTWHRSESWWSQGHGTFIEDTTGRWWVMYHGMAHGRRSGGRSTLLLPLQWTDDGWPYLPDGISADQPLRKPAGTNVGHGMPLSDTFAGPQLGPQWDPGETVENFDQTYRMSDGALHMAAKGDSPSQATRLLGLPVNVSYELTVEVNTSAGNAAGLGIFADTFTGIETRSGGVSHPRRGNNFLPNLYPDQHVFLKVRHRDHDVTFYHSADGENWTLFPWGASTSVESTQRIGLYAGGTGTVQFRNFTYRGLP